jgi:anti-sigma factor RsiW
MDCDEVRERLPDFLAGEVDRTARAAVEAHLAACAECSGAVEMWAKLGALPDEQPSPALRARFEAMLAAYREGVEQTQRRRFSFGGWLESWWPRRPAFQFGIAVVCLIAGGVAGRSLTSRGDGADLARLREEVQNTRQLVAVSLMQQQSASERLRGVNWSYRVAQPDQEVLSALLGAVRYDPSVDVRLAAVDALRRYTSEPQVRQGLLEALGGSQSPLVQIALIDLMVETRDRQTVDALRRLKDDKAVNEAVRQRADWGLQHF